MSLWDYIGNIQKTLGNDVKNDNVPSKNNRVPFGPSLDTAKNLAPVKAYSDAYLRLHHKPITNVDVERFRQDTIKGTSAVLGFVAPFVKKAYAGSPIAALDKLSRGNITKYGKKALLAGQETTRANYAFVRASADESLGLGLFAALTMIVGGTAGAIAGGAAGLTGTNPVTVGAGALAGFKLGSQGAGALTRKLAKSGTLDFIDKKLTEDAAIAESAVGQEHYNFGRDTVRQIARIKGFKTLGDTEKGIGALLSGPINFGAETFNDIGITGVNVGGKLLKGKILGSGVTPTSQGLLASAIGRATGLTKIEMANRMKLQVDLIEKTMAGETTQLTPFFKFVKENDATTVGNHPKFKDNGMGHVAGSVLAGKTDEEIGLVLLIGLGDKAAIEKLSSLPQYADTLSELNRYNSAVSALETDGMIWFKHDNQLMMVGKKYQDGNDLIRAELAALGEKNSFIKSATSLEGWMQTSKGASPLAWVERMRADKAIRSTAVKLSAGNQGKNPLKWKGVSESELVTGIKQESLYGKMVTSFYQNSFLSVPMHIISHATDDVPHATINFNDGIKSTVAMRSSLRLAVRRKAITETEASDIMNEFVSARLEGDKMLILEKYHEKVIRNIAINHGHVGNSATVEAVLEKYIKNHRLTKKEANLAFIKQQAYMVGEDGKAIIHPQLISQLANGGFLPDIATLDKAFKEFSLDRVPALLRAGRLTTYSAKMVADEMQSVWRNAVLARGGFTANIMRDVNARAWGDSSMFSMYAQLTDKMLSKISNGINTVKNIRNWDMDVLSRKRNLKKYDEEIENHRKFILKQKADLESNGYYGPKKKPKQMSSELTRAVETFDKLEGTLAELRRQREGLIKNIPTRVIQKGKKTIAGWDVPLSDEGTLGEISLQILNGGEGIRAALASMRELEISNLRRGTSGADVILATEKSKEHLAAWLNMLNDHLRNDPLAVKIMEGKMDRYDLMNWLREDAQSDYLERFGMVILAKGEKARPLRKDDAEYLIDRVSQAVDSIAAHPDIRNSLLTGKVTAVQLEKLYPKVNERPPVAGDVITSALGTNNPLRYLLNKQRDVVTWLATKPTAVLNYNHYFAAKYYEKWETLIIHANERGITPDAATIRQYETIARSHAITEYRNKINSFSKDMNFAGLMNYTLAFFPAVVEQFRAYGRIFLDNPEFPIRLAYAAAIPEALGNVQQDSFGNPYVEFVAPFTGMTVRLDARWFNVVNPTGQTILGPGPLAVALAKASNKFVNTEETLLGNFLLPFGSDGNILSSYTPTTWKRTVQMLQSWSNSNSGQIEKDKEMLMKQYLYEHIADSGSNNPSYSDLNKIAARAVKDAKSISLLRFLAAWSMPSQPKIVTAISYYQDRFNEAVNKDSQNGAADFIAKNPDFFMLVDKLNNSVSGVFPDRTSVTLMQKHQNVTLEIASSVGGNFTALGAIFNDANFAYSSSADAWLKQNTIPGFPDKKYKESQGSLESMQSTIVNKGWDDWYKLIQVVSTTMQKPQYNLDPTSGYGLTVLDSYKKAFIEQQKTSNPMWYDEKVSSLGGGSTGKQAAIVKAITIAANTPEMWADLSQQPRWWAIAEYMNYRYEVNSDLKVRGVSYDSKAAQDVREKVNKKVWELKRKDVQFAKFYERYFSNDDFSFTYNYAPPSGSK